MNKLLAPLPALVLACGVVAAPDAGAAAAKSDAASQPMRKAAKADAASLPTSKAAKAARAPAATASANEIGVNPAKAAEPTKGPPRQMKQTEAESNSSK